MKAKSKRRDLLKVVAVSAVALGMFATALVGANRLAFMAATNGSTPVEMAATNISQPLQVASSLSQTYEVQNTYGAEVETEAAVFTQPNITVIQGELQPPQAIPANAISIDEAAQLGAKYIWDVFGTHIEGLYVEMTYIMMPGFTRPFWIGTVSDERPVNLDFATFMYENDDCLDAWVGAMVLPLYSFRLDAITGMRIDVGYSNPSHLLQSRRSAEERDESETVVRIGGGYVREVNESEMNFWSRWHEMDVDARIAYTDLTPERIAGYTQQALDLAQRHFNFTTVEDIRIGDAWNSASNVFFIERLLDKNSDGEYVAIVSSISFIVTDSTGRDAEVRIPTANASWLLTSVHTMHNEFIPGFSYGDGAGGRG